MSNNLAIYRVRYNIKQKTLAEICNIAVPTYCNKEKGVKAEFTHSEMVAITNFFKQYNKTVTVSDLFFNEKCFI